MKRILLILFVLTFLLSSCITSIKKISKKRDKFQDKKVWVRGKVVSSLDLKEINCFTIRNRKGNILVVTDNFLPLKRDRLWVRGTIDFNFEYKDKLILVIHEKKKRLRKRPKSKNIPDKIKS